MARKKPRTVEEQALPPLWKKYFELGDRDASLDRFVDALCVARKRLDMSDEALLRHIRKRRKRLRPEYLSDAAVRKMARQIVDAHASDGIEAFDRAGVVERIQEIASRLSSLDYWVLVMRVFKELSFREMGKREHLKKKDVERIFDEVCKKIERMFGRFGTQEV